jgi:sugar lactone lactonase YvrE
MSRIALLWLVLVTFALGCVARGPLPGTSGPDTTGAGALAAGSQATSLSGRIEAMPGFHVQLTDLLNDFAKGATVSLIEVSTGETRGTSLADDNGRFVIQFGATFSPARPGAGAKRSVAYYLEAVKGLKGKNSAPNQAGADAMRLRTMVWFDDDKGGWISLANANAGSLSISLSTTTVAFFVNQKVVNGEVVNSEAFIGSLDPTKGGQAPNDYTAVGELTLPIYSNLLTQIVNAVTNDQDPIQTLILTGSGQAVNTSTDLQVSGISPQSAAIGATLTISGSNLEPGLVQVEFIGAAGTVDQPNSNKNSLKVPVPPGARTGLVKVSLNGKTQYTPPLTVTTEDGHRVSFTGANGATVLYAGSFNLGTLVRINPDGSTTTLSTALSQPTAVLVNPERSAGPNYNIYVTDKGTDRIVQLSQAGAVVNSNWYGITEPYALVLGPDNDLYVAQRSLGNIVRVRVNWATGAITNSQVARYTGFSLPIAMAFDFNGYLYVVENGAGKVRRFKPDAADSGDRVPATLDWGYLSDPTGITIDTAGNAFVTSSSNNVVVKIDAVRNMSAFQSLDGAGTIARDAAGNLYVADRTRNLIRRVTLAGDKKIVAYGLSALRGVAVDAGGNVYTSLQASGAVLKIAADGVTTSPLISGIAAPYGLTLRNGKLYVAHTDTQNVTEVTLAGAARSVIPSGLHSPGGVEVSDDGQTYYVGRLSLQDCWYCSVPFDVANGQSREPWEHSGLDIVTGSTVTLRRALVHGSSDWGGFAQALVKLSNTSFALLDRGKRNLTLMTDHAAGTNAQKIQDVTPSFGGIRKFPEDVYDMVYDGSRYLYVSGASVYRIDTQNYGSAAVVIGGISGQPYGLAYAGGVVYVVDSSNKTVRRITSPASASSADGVWSANLAAAGATSPIGITSYNGDLYVTDRANPGGIYKVVTAGPSVTKYLGMTNGATRIHSYNDGRLLIRSNDGVYYLVSTANPPVPSQHASTIGCTGCGILEYYVDAPNNNNIYWSQPRQQVHLYASGLLNTRELARDGNWLYIAATRGIYGMELSSGEEYSGVGMGAPTGLAVNSSTREVYVLNSVGTLYSVDYASRTATSRGAFSNFAGFGPSGWGLDYDQARNVLYAASPGQAAVYKVEPANGWAKTVLKAGLHAPMF